MVLGAGWTGWPTRPPGQPPQIMGCSYPCHESIFIKGRTGADETSVGVTWILHTREKDAVGNSQLGSPNQAG